MENRAVARPKSHWSVAAVALFVFFGYFYIGEVRFLLFADLVDGMVTEHRVYREERVPGRWRGRRDMVRVSFTYTGRDGRTRAGAQSFRSEMQERYPVGVPILVERLSAAARIAGTADLAGLGLFGASGVAVGVAAYGVWRGSGEPSRKDPGVRRRACGSDREN